MKLVGRGGARAFCVLAVLIGLFGMHGVASGDGTSCHPMPAAVSATASIAMPVAVPIPAKIVMPSAAPAAPKAAMLATAQIAMPVMGSCVFVAPPGWSPLALAALAILGAAALSGIGIRRAPETSGRSPPNSLLQRVCVSRT